MSTNISMVKVLSWNILAVEFVKKSYYPMLNIDSINDRPKRIKKIVKRLIEENADIILLQEVMIYELNYLKSHLTNYHFSDFCKIDWDKYKNSTESGNITLFKKSYFLSNFVSNRIKYNGSTFGLYLMLYPKNSKNVWNVFNIHLDDQFYQTRNAQINSIRPLLSRLKYCIIVGDFNQEYNEKSKLYTIKDFTVLNDDITYFIEEYVNIDNILTKGFLKIKTFVSYDYKNIPKQKLFNLFGSDHIPIIAKLDK